DDVPESLQQIGYTVKILTDGDITEKNLAQFSVVVLGIRAYNTDDRISTWLPELFAYVKNGGVAIAQYNTTADLKTKEMAPYTLEISRDRVTDENAEVRILAPNHPLVTTPNKITSKDFDGWVQERGLYFPSKWGAAWTPILSCNDPKEKPLDGGLLVATILAIPLYGLWRTRLDASLGQYLKGDASIRWATIGLSVLATQAGPITFLSMPGQAYESGIGFIQNYFGQPLALIVVCAVFV